MKSMHGLGNTSRNLSVISIKLHNAKKKLYVNTIHKVHCLLWAEANLKWAEAKWKTGLRSELKRRRAIWLIQHPLIIWRCGTASEISSLHMWKGTISAERFIHILEQHMLPCRWYFFQGRPCIFYARPHITVITTAWLRSRRVLVLNWPGCSAELSPTENTLSIIKCKIHQRRPWTRRRLQTVVVNFVFFLYWHIWYVLADLKMGLWDLQMITFSFYLQLFFGIGLVCFQFTNAVWRHQSELIN